MKKFSTTTLGLIALLTIGAGCRSKTINTNTSTTNTNVAPMTNSSTQEAVVGSVVIDSFGYGYTVAASFNGKTISDITGRSSQSVRLLAINDSDCLAMPASTKDASCIVRAGGNDFQFTYTRNADASSSQHLEITVQANGYTVPLYHFDTKKASGTVQKNITVQATQPAGFSTTEQTDE